MVIFWLLNGSFGLGRQLSSYLLHVLLPAFQFHTNGFSNKIGFWLSKIFTFNQMHIAHATFCIFSFVLFLESRSVKSWKCLHFFRIRTHVLKLPGIRIKYLKNSRSGSWPMQIKFLTGFSHACVCVSCSSIMWNSHFHSCVYPRLEAWSWLPAYTIHFLLLKLQFFAYENWKSVEAWRPPIYILLYLLHYIGLKAFICVMYLYK